MFDDKESIGFFLVRNWLVRKARYKISHFATSVFITQVYADCFVFTWHNNMVVKQNNSKALCFSYDWSRRQFLIRAGLLTSACVAISSFAAKPSLVDASTSKSSVFPQHQPLRFFPQLSLLEIIPNHH